MKLKPLLAASAAVALLASAAGAQMFGEEAGTDLDPEGFRSGLAEAGTFKAWDVDEDAGLSEPETATGMFVAMDQDNDLRLDEAEYEKGMERWYGPGFEVAFSEYDADGSGLVEPAEFGAAYDHAAYAAWDTDRDGVLSVDEFTTGTFAAADADRDMVISAEEEDWFEGWFDGDDIEAEIEAAAAAM